MNIKKSALRESARDKECQARIPGVCNFDERTTVLAHLNTGGTGGKAHDIHAAYMCSNCHDVFDRRVTVKEYSYDDIKIMCYEAVFRTQIMFLSDGLIKVEGET